jgi:hypothetical protein
MLAANIETRIREILEKSGKGGWLRVQECANEFARDPVTKKINSSQKTKFYRWRKKVEKKQVEGFQICKLQGNMSFIGLDSADPKIISSELAKDANTDRSIRRGFGFWDWIMHRSERKERAKKEKIRRYRRLQYYNMEEFFAIRIRHYKQQINDKHMPGFAKRAEENLKDIEDYLQRKRKELEIDDD